MIFGDWPEDLHFDPEQLIRIERAKQISSKDVYINRESMSGSIIGSKKPNSKDRHIYTVDTNSCTCGDFIDRKVPCKHMYRIAIECGLINQYNEQLFQEAVGAIENLPDEAQQFLKAVFGVVAPENYGTFWVEYDDKKEYIVGTSWQSADYSHIPLEWLSTNPFLDIVPIQLFHLPIDEIWGILEIHNIHPDEALNLRVDKKKLIDWCKKSIPNINSYLPNRLYVYALYHQKVMYKVLQYLRRKFDMNEFSYVKNRELYKIQYPCGAKFESGLLDTFCSENAHGPYVCFFPDDEVTKLLTQYGHNRCLNGCEVAAK